MAKELTRLPYVSAFLFCQKADCTLKSESADEGEDTSAGEKCRIQRTNRAVTPRKYRGSEQTLKPAYGAGQWHHYEQNWLGKAIVKIVPAGTFSISSVGG